MSVMTSGTGQASGSAVAASAPVEPALLDARDAAALCGMSRAAWYKAAASGKIPRPVRIGGAVRWRRDELLQWIAAGCPSRARWDAMSGKK